VAGGDHVRYEYGALGGVHRDLRRRRVRRSGTFSADRKDAIYGPFAAYIPIVGILLAAH
jgi:hypothetical protein